MVKVWLARGKVDSALRALSTLRGLRGAPEVPPLCRETQSLGQQMLNTPFGINGLTIISNQLTTHIIGRTRIELKSILTKVIWVRNLNFKNHINHISTNISKSAGILYRLNSYPPSNIVKLLYNVLFLPYVTYDIESWYGAPRYMSNKVNEVQKKLSEMYDKTLVTINTLNLIIY